MRKETGGHLLKFIFAGLRAFLLLLLHARGLRECPRLCCLLTPLQRRLRRRCFLRSAAGFRPEKLSPKLCHRFHHSLATPHSGPRFRAAARLGRAKATGRARRVPASEREIKRSIPTVQAPTAADVASREPRLNNPQQTWRKGKDAR